jgi:hypothetical protein
MSGIRAVYGPLLSNKVHGEDILNVCRALGSSICGVHAQEEHSSDQLSTSVSTLVFLTL